MPIAHFDSVEIHYEIIGHQGPWIAVVSSGRQPFADVEIIARHVASHGYRVIVHDRRNCGRSSLTFDTFDTEENIWADDLGRLLNHLGVDQAFVAGLSRGARIAVRFALRHPERTRALLLWGISGGTAAVRYLDDFYFGKYLRACAAGGMEAVCASDHFAGMIASRPENREALLAMDPVHFMSVMERRRVEFLAVANHQVMGLRDDELNSITVPTAIVPYYDRMHPMSATAHAHEMIPGSRVFDFESRLASEEASRVTEPVEKPAGTAGRRYGGGVMAGFRARVRWMVSGRSDTTAALGALSADLRALQQQVAAIEQNLHELEHDHQAVSDRQLDEFDRVRHAVASVTDDLSLRIAALHERLGPAS